MIYGLNINQLCGVSLKLSVVLRSKYNWHERALKKFTDMKVFVPLIQAYSFCLLVPCIVLFPQNYSSCLYGIANKPLGDYTSTEMDCFFVI